MASHSHPYRLQAAKAEDLKIIGAIVTHYHFDHTGMHIPFCDTLIANNDGSAPISRSPCLRKSSFVDGYPFANIFCIV